MRWLRRLLGNDDEQDFESLAALWDEQMLELGRVEFSSRGARVAVVDDAGVRLPSRNLFVAWEHLGFADEGLRDAGLGERTLSLTVSRTWWAEIIDSSSGSIRRRAESEFDGDWASPVVTFAGSRRLPVAAFAEWLSAQAIIRAPLPQRLCLSPGGDHYVSDRDTNREVPLDRLPISRDLRERIERWGAAPDALSPEEVAGEEAWERFWPEGRILAQQVEAETGRPAAVWRDCPDVP